jgi:hypothetical protein
MPQHHTSEDKNSQREDRYKGRAIKRKKKEGIKI